MKIVHESIIFVFLISLLAGCKAPPDYYVYLGDKYYAEEKYDLAIEAYKKALLKGYASRGAINNLGLIYHYDTKEFSASEEIFKEGLKLYPDDASLHYNLSQLYFDMNRLPRLVYAYLFGALSSLVIYLFLTFLVYGVLPPTYENMLFGIIYTTTASYVSTLIPLLIILS